MTAQHKAGSDCIDHLTFAGSVCEDCGRGKGMTAPLSRRDLAAAIATYALVVVGIPAVFILAAVLHGWRFH